MKIVCGTDFSTRSGEAELVAAAIAKRLGTELELVHVIDMRRTALPTALPLMFEPVEEMLAARAKKLEQDYGIAVASVVLEGAAEERLADFALEAQARLLVVASLADREQGAFSVGSVAERLIQRSKVPVLVVRDANRIRAWLQGERSLRVMLGVDLGEASRAALHWVQDLRRIAPCDLKIVQMVWPALEHSRYGIPTPMFLEGIRPELLELLERDLRSWVGTVAGEGELSLSVEPGWGRSDSQLCLLAARDRPDLVVVGTHRKSSLARLWQGSVSRGVLHGTETNVACVPRVAAAESRTSIVQFRRVLIPTDFSELGNRAVAAGYGLLRSGGEAHLVHVRTVEDRELSLRELEARLRALIPEAAVALGIETRVHVIADHEASSGIVSLAERMAVDAICMSTHGRSGVSELVLGSQAHEVVRIADKPVLLIKPERA